MGLFEYLFFIDIGWLYCVILEGECGLFEMLESWKCFLFRVVN